MGNWNNFKAVLTKYFRKEEVLLVPNILCYFRILLIVLFVCLYLIPFSINGKDKAGLYLSAAVMIIASYTDFLDGFIARKFNQMSELGKLLDPIADKLLQFAVSVCLCIKLYNFISIWLLFVLYTLKEIQMLIETIVLARNNRSFGGAKWYGKASTFITYVVLGTLLIAGPFIFEAYPLNENPLICHLIIDSLAALCISFQFFAQTMYTILFVHIQKYGADEVILGKEKKS
jgi:cardiolipin synthase (CMP-forming)